MSTLRVLVVCTANVCRSAMAEAMLAGQLSSRGVTAAVESAGTQGDRHSLPVDPVAVRVLAERGIDISQHQPRVVTRELMQSSDLVITMTRQHLREVAVLVPGAFAKTFTLREVVRRAAIVSRGVEGFDPWLAALNEHRSARELMGDDGGDDIGDPYGLSLQAHEACADDLTMLCGQLALALSTLPR